MIWSLSVYVVATKILFVAAAPKLRYILFDPLTYEAKAGLFSARRDSAVVGNPTTNTPADQDTSNFILSDSSGEFLENDANVTEQIENKTSSTPTTTTTKTKTSTTITQTTSKEVEKPAPELRSKSCFSCIGSLRTGESASVPLKSLPIYLRTNENQKGYPKFGYEFDEAACKLIGKRILCGYNKNPGTIPNSKETIHVDAECRIRGDRIECGYGNTNGGGGSGKRALKLSLPKEENEATFKLKDIIQLESTFNQEAESLPEKDHSVTEENKSTPVKEDSVIIEIKSQVEPNEVIQNAEFVAYSTKAETVNDKPTTSTVSTTHSTTSTVKNAITDTTTPKETTMEKETSTATAGTDIEITSKIPFLSLRSIMKMSEDLDKIARQGRETETTEYVQAVTRCVEIGDRIVCYNYKPRPTTPSTAPSSTTATSSTSL